MRSEGEAASAAGRPPPIILTKEQQALQAAKRAALLKRLAALPEHLRLGVTLAGMRELLEELPDDAVEQVNAKIPRKKGCLLYTSPSPRDSR